MLMLVIRGAITMCPIILRAHHAITLTLMFNIYLFAAIKKRVHI